MLAALLALSLAAAPGGHTFAVDPAASSARYRIVHKLHTVEAASRKVEGKVVVSPDGRVLAMFRAPVSSFESGDGNRDAHMQEALEVSAHPFVVLKATASAPALAQASAAPAATLDVQAELDLHGVKRSLAFPVKLEPGPDGGVRARASFDVSLDGHRIERPSLLFVKTDDACRIDVDLVLREVKP